MHFSLSTIVLASVLGTFQLVNAASTKRIRNPTCDALVPIVQQIQDDLFDGGECGDEALSALRLAFHDAMGFSIHGGKGGGADGSILIFNETENAFVGNLGIDDITGRQFPVFQKTGLSAGDFVQLAAAIGTSNCRGAPSLKYFHGRPPPTGPAPDHTVPTPVDDVTSIIERFADAGFSVFEIIALLVSHTIATAQDIDPSIQGAPFDSTVGVFDTQFFLEVLLKGKLNPGKNFNPGEALSPMGGEMRIQSDFLLARDPRTACFWQDMIDNQFLATTTFKAAMTKLQLLGQNVAELTDCSEIIPTAAPFNSHIKYPASFSEADVEISCPNQPFPSLATVAGPPPSLLPLAKP